METTTSAEAVLRTDRAQPARLRGALLALFATVAALVAFPGAAQPPAGSIQFDSTNDSIEVGNNTVLGTTATIEARVFFPTANNGTGRVFNEWVGFQEDKAFDIGPGSLFGYFHDVQSQTAVQASPSISLDAWHHVALVYEDAASSGSEVRLYLDGTLAAMLTGGGDIADSVSGLPYIGAICRDSTIVPAFRGYLDTIRVSNIARYSGNFAAPSGDLTSDANTLFLYNFSAQDFFDDMGTPKVNDLSANNSDGTLGGSPDGCEGITSPSLPPEPTPTPTATLIPSPTPDPSPTGIPTNTSTPSATLTASATATPSATATQTRTPTATATRTSTSTSTATATPSSTATPTPTRTINTPTITNTASPTRTVDLSAPAGPPAIPTLTEAGLALLAFGLFGLGLFALRRR